MASKLKLEIGDRIRITSNNDKPFFFANSQGVVAYFDEDGDAWVKFDVEPFVHCIDNTWCIGHEEQHSDYVIV